MKYTFIVFFVFPLLVFSQLKYPNQENGIYSMSNQKIYPSLIGGQKFGNTGIAILTMGIVSQNRRPYLLASTSNQKLKNEPFEFRFGSLVLDDNNIPIYDRAFRDAQSPKEFILLRLEPNARKGRRIILKEKNGWCWRIKQKAIPFQFKEIKNGVFKVTTLKPLEKGEYAFVHQDILNTPNFKEFLFFDFSIGK